MKQLSREARLKLMKFVCSFAWADLEVRDEERALVKRMIKRLKLDADEARQVEEWLDLPPPPEEVDPTSVPRAHREILLAAVREMVTVDGVVSPEESESLTLLEALLA